MANNLIEISIGKVADMLDVKSHVIRYWSDQFAHIKCNIKSGERRYYDQVAIQELSKVKKLIHEYGMTINGIKNLIKYNKIDIDLLDKKKDNNSKEKVIEIKKNLNNIIEKIDLWLS